MAKSERVAVNFPAETRIDDPVHHRLGSGLLRLGNEHGKTKKETEHLRAPDFRLRRKLVTRFVGPENMKYTCPCCGYLTLDEKPPGTYAICAICFWEDDGVQFHDPDYEGGANQASLREAQQNVVEFGACEQRCVAYIRPPTDEDRRDPNWMPLEPVSREELLKKHPPTFIAGPDGTEEIRNGPTR